MAWNSLASSRFHTMHLLEVIVSDPAEYVALTDAKKARVRMILSCGIINMGENNPVKDEFFTLFPEGTTIGDNVLALLEYTAPPEEP